LALRTAAPRAERVRIKQSAARAVPETTVLDEKGAALFDLLREERRAMAQEQGVPAYVVFHDATLREIATRRPESLEGLLEVPGIGTAKAERYGQRILAVLEAVADR
jgi:ATP-dependent DNA helicase RecQ